MVFISPVKIEQLKNLAKASKRNKLLYPLKSKQLINKTSGAVTLATAL